MKLNALRRELRRLAPGLRITEDELAELLRLEVLKRSAGTISLALTSSEQLPSSLSLGVRRVLK